MAIKKTVNKIRKVERPKKVVKPAQKAPLTKKPSPKTLSSEPITFSLPRQNRIQTAEGWKRDQIRLRQERMIKR